MPAPVLEAVMTEILNQGVQAERQEQKGRFYRER